MQEHHIENKSMHSWGHDFLVVTCHCEMWIFRKAEQKTFDSFANGSGENCWEYFEPDEQQILLYYMK